MKKASVATAKNELSRLLRCVKRGERIVITERDLPIAQLQPFIASNPDDNRPALAQLHEAGVLSLPMNSSLDVASFLSLPASPVSTKQTLTAAVLAERKEGR